MVREESLASRSRMYTYIGVSPILLSLSISLHFLFIVATATHEELLRLPLSLLRRFRLALDHRRVFVLVLNLRLAAQPVAFPQFLPEFLPLRVRRSTQTLARIAHDHRTGPALAVATAIHEF